MKHSEKGKLNHLAEEAPILGIQFSQGGHEILNQDEAESLLDLSPERNIDKETQIIQFRRFLDRWQQVAPDIENWSAQRADQLLQLHLQVREAIEIRREGRVISDQTIQCQQPLDLLGVNIIMPLKKAMSRRYSQFLIFVVKGGLLPPELLDRISRFDRTLPD